MKTALGPYAIVSELGRGGMGVVYKAYEPALQRYVAIKALAPALAHQPGLVERFLREARAMAAVSDPHVLPIYRIDEDAEGPWFAMEWVDGENLAQVAGRLGRLPEAQALDLIRQAAQGLAAAHARGLVHRDIKPANLLLGSNGVLKIADFGIARAQRDASARLTGTGDVIGTPGYLSPEACLGHPIDARTDLFALGIVLYELVSGRLPFEADSPFKTMQQVVQEPVPELASLGVAVHPATAALLDALLAKSPTERPEDASALVRALDAHPLLAGPRVPLRATPAPAAAPTVVSPVPGLASVSAEWRPADAGRDAPTPTPAGIANNAAARRPAWLLPVAIAGVAALAALAWTLRSPDRSGSSASDMPRAADVRPAAEAAPAVVEPVEPETTSGTTPGPAVAPVPESTPASEPATVVETPPVETAPPPAPAIEPPPPAPPPPAEPAPAPEAAGPVARYGEAYTGPGLVEVALADIPDADAAYVRVTGINHPWDGQVIRVQHRAGPRDGRDYFLQHDGSEYVMLVKRRGYPSGRMQAWLYVPDLGDVGELTEAPDAARALDTATLRDGWAGRNPD
jgi:serine/threonine-protein kinase